MFQSAVWFEIVLILGLILLNGVFAMSEIALVSARRPRLRQRAEAGSRGARRALYLTEHQTRFLSTVQVGITSIGVLAGAYGGASIAAHLDVWLERFPSMDSYSEPLALGVVVVAITFASLILGELVPKRVALDHPESIASLLAPPMHALSVAASPVVRLLSATTEGIFRLLRLPPPSEPAVTEEDVTAMVEQGAAAGVFETAEADLVERVFRLGDRRVGALMTPRHRIEWIDVNDPVEAQMEELRRHRHSRYVVADGNVDRVLGIVRAIDLIPDLLDRQAPDVRRLLQQPLFVPGTVAALDLLARFRDSGVQLAVVVDEHGGVAGLVTLNDVLDEISGEIATGDEALIIERADGSWLVDAATPWSEFAEAVGSSELAIASHPFNTLGGLVFQRFGRIPDAGDRFEAFGFLFEVVDMDGRRIDKLLVTRTGNPASA